MSCLHSLLGYSTGGGGGGGGGVQVLQFIVLVAFDAVDIWIPSCILGHFLEI